MPFYERIEKIAKALDRPWWYISGALMIFCTLLAFAAVVMRYIFNISFMVVEELIRFAFIGVVYFWAGPIIRTGEHIRLELFTAKLQGKSKEIHTIFVAVLSMVISGLMVRWGITLIKTSIMLQEKSESFLIPMAGPYLIIPIGMALYFIYSLLELLKASSALLQKDKENK